MFFNQSSPKKLLSFNKPALKLESNILNTCPPTLILTTVDLESFSLPWQITTAKYSKSLKVFKDILCFLSRASIFSFFPFSFISSSFSSYYYFPFLSVPRLY